MRHEVLNVLSLFSIVLILFLFFLSCPLLSLVLVCWAKCYRSNSRDREREREEGCRGAEVKVRSTEKRCDVFHHRCRVIASWRWMSLFPQQSCPVRVAEARASELAAAVALEVF